MNGTSTVSLTGGTPVGVKWEVNARKAGVQMPGGGTGRGHVSYRLLGRLLGNQWLLKELARTKNEALRVLVMCADEVGLPLES